MMDTNTQTTPRTEGDPARLVRPRADRVAAGVAIGLAQRLDVPAWVVRLVFVVLTFFGGAGIPLYVLGWLFIPNEDEEKSIAVRALSQVDGTASWIGVGLIALALLIAIGSIGFIRGDLAFAVVLVVVGILLYRGDLAGITGQSTSDTTTDSGPDVEDAPASETPAAPLIDQPEESDMTSTLETGVGETTPPPPTETAPPRPPRPPRRPKHPPSILGRLTIGLGLIAIGAMAFADYAMTTFDPSARHYFGLAMAITGLGLVVGGWLGRARGLIVLGVILVPPLIVSPFVEFGFDGPIGERRISPQSLAELEDEYRLAIGEMVIDLRDVDFGSSQATLDARVGIGSLEIIVPDGIGVEAEGRVGIGEVQLFGSSRSGFARTAESGSGELVSLVIDARTNLGQVDIRSGSGAASAVGVGDVDLRITEIASLESSYSWNAGNIVVDLSDLDLSTVEFGREVRFDLGTGDLTVLVDDADDVDVTTSVGVGRIEVFGERVNGLGLELPYDGEADAELVLDIEVGAGKLVVEEG